MRRNGSAAAGGGDARGGGGLYRGWPGLAGVKGATKGLRGLGRGLLLSQGRRRKQVRVVGRGAHGSRGRARATIKGSWEREASAHYGQSGKQVVLGCEVKWGVAALQGCRRRQGATAFGAGSSCPMGWGGCLFTRWRGGGNGWSVRSPGAAGKTRGVCSVGVSHHAQLGAGNGGVPNCWP